ncbi:hypothetical protein HYFRA_00006057 [Hymenoscyphus fraxineus]|uniref:Uncharacterized protein n=1 Tax=Hymenoscyphus fraxineus TaxID=746836 RepID=A0A9N9KUC9_9HELO|nr:hypothetical protein HYFRA_00006057 [Hymenoscyphus fraxineus]
MNFRSQQQKIQFNPRDKSPQSRFATRYLIHHLIPTNQPSPIPRSRTPKNYSDPATYTSHLQAKRLFTLHAKPPSVFFPQSLQIS